jgi:hypothetical protein
MNIAKYGKHFANGLWSYLGDTLHWGWDLQVIKENPITDCHTEVIAETGVDPNSDSEDEQ